MYQKFSQPFSVGDIFIICDPILVMTFPEWLSMAAHTRRHVSVLVVFAVFLRAHVQFCRFDQADATADVQRHCNHWPPL